ncbi:MAG: insulinase family protein [Deltaproteobacteria bacterium]|nr:MAG: insulinase family protein [Deltaproteobacteria bacterium]
MVPQGPRPLPRGDARRSQGLRREASRRRSPSRARCGTGAEREMKILPIVAGALVFAACSGSQTRPDGVPLGSQPDAGVAAPVVKEPTPAPPASAASRAPEPQKPSEPPLMPDQPFRNGRPEPVQRAAKFDAPVPIERKLKNGARVLIVPNHSVPLVAVEVRLLHGVDAVPIAKAGLAELVADAVLEGTRKRSAEQLARDIEDIAAHLTSSAGNESTAVHLNCLSEQLPKGLDILADVVTQPAFRPADVERVRTLRLARLLQKQANIGQLAADEARRLMYGADHPLGQPDSGTPAIVQKIQRREIAAQHKAWWVPNDSVIAVAGDVDPDEAMKLLERAFASWRPRPMPELELPPPRPAGKRFISLVEKPSATQSQVWVVGPLFPARDPDAVPLEIANNVLGGVFTSRLNLNLREKHGYSYGVFSALQLGRLSGNFRAQGGIIAKSTVPAAAEYEKEIAAFASGDMTEDELRRARDTYIRTLPSQLETSDAVASAMANLVVLGRPLDYYKTLPDRAQALTREQVVDVVKKWVKPESWPVVIVGPVGDARAELEKLGFGPVEKAAVPP